MQVQQVVVDINSLEQCLYAVLLAADVPDVPFVLLVQRVHDAVHHQRCLPPEFLQLHEHAVTGNASFGIVPEPVLHLDGELCRFVLVNHIKGIETAVGSDDGEVCFPLKAFYRRLDAYHVFRSRRLVRYDVKRTQIHIFHFGRKKDMHGFPESHLNPVRCDNLVGGKYLCFHRLLCFCPQQGEQHDY